MIFDENVFTNSVIQREESQKLHPQASQPKLKDLNLRGKGGKPNASAALCKDDDFI